MAGRDKAHDDGVGGHIFERKTSKYRNCKNNWNAKKADRKETVESQIYEPIKGQFSKTILEGNGKQNIDNDTSVQVGQ